MSSNLEIKKLSNTSIETIIACMSEAFKNYFVELPTDPAFWGRRYHAARVDYSLSFGVWDKDELVAIAIHGVDFHEG